MSEANLTLSTIPREPCHCQTSQAVYWIELCIDGIGIPVISLLGVLGNVIAFLVFRYQYLIILISFLFQTFFRHRQHIRSTFHTLLSVLALVDSLCLISFFIDQSLAAYWRIRPDIYLYILPLFWYPLKNIFLSWETFLVIALAIERFVAVCRYF